MTIQTRSRTARAERAARWQQYAANVARPGLADPDHATKNKISPRRADEKLQRAFTMPEGKRPCSGDSSGCSCRACVLNRWQTRMPAAAANLNRAAVREVASWSSTSSASDKSPRNSTSSEHRAFGFAVRRTVDEFVANNGRGPAMCIEARELSEGRVEQKITLADLEVSVIIEELSVGAARQLGERALPERQVTVSKRRQTSRANAASNDNPMNSSQRSSGAFEVVWRTRCLAPPSTSLESPASLEEKLEELAARTKQRMGVVESGDAFAAAALLDAAAKAYGTSVEALVEAVRVVAPAERGAQGQLGAAIAAIAELGAC